MPQNHPIFNPFCCTAIINSHEIKLSISKISRIKLFYRFKLIIPIWRVIPLRSTSNRSVMRYQNKYNNKRSIFWGLLKSQEMRGRVPVNRRGKNPPPAVAPIQQTRYAKYECWNWKKYHEINHFSLYLCSDEGSSLGNSHINISAGFSGLASKILPLMPTDGALTFEIIIFGFMFVSLLLQYLNLYRSVWWLPHSYNNNAVVRWWSYTL